MAIAKGRYLLVFLCVQLVVMALLYREGYRKRVAYFFGIFYKNGPHSLVPNPQNISLPGDVYANLSLIAKPAVREDLLPYCPETSPYIGKWSTSVRGCSPVSHNLESSWMGMWGARRCPLKWGSEPDRSTIGKNGSHPGVLECRTYVSAPSATLSLPKVLMGAVVSLSSPSNS